MALAPVAEDAKGDDVFSSSLEDSGEYTSCNPALHPVSRQFSNANTSSSSPLGSPIFDEPVKLRARSSSAASSEDLSERRRRSTSLIETKTRTDHLLRDRLKVAQDELRRKRDENEEMKSYLEELNQACMDLHEELFTQANSQVSAALEKKAKAEMELEEFSRQNEALRAEMAALKDMVLTSTPGTPNKHLHPQLADTNHLLPPGVGAVKLGHKRSSSHHELTKEGGKTEADGNGSSGDSVDADLDTMVFQELENWLADPKLDLQAPFLARCLRMDILPCVDFANADLAAEIQEAAKDNVALHIEPLRAKDTVPKERCVLVLNRMSSYRMKISHRDGTESIHYISQLARNRIIAVCNFFNYIGYVVKGLVRGDNQKLYQQVQARRREMALARLGFDTGL